MAEKRSGFDLGKDGNIINEAYIFPSRYQNGL